MASADLQRFLEDRLLALEPNIDLSPGSPAQTKFIDPVVTYLGTDPFETDIDKFILDRFAQEYPDLYAADPGALRDLFVKPLQLILEPFKRETQSIKRGQSLADPSQLSDDDADALVANVFDSRDQGGYAVGQARAYFPNPTSVRIEVGNKVFSDSGLNFFPTNPVSISAELMVFNREGTLYYLDIPVRAEKAGADYNLDVASVAGIEGVPNVVRCTNLKKFSGGSERQDNTTFVSAAETSLTERSLANRRGTVARLNTVFKGQLRAVQVTGAKDPEMQRDILGATSPGHAWITGTVDFYKDIAYVRARTIEGSVAAVPVPGDTLYLYLFDPAAGSNPDQQDRFIRLQVEELLFSQDVAPSYQWAYLVRWSDAFGNLSRVLGSGYQTYLDSLPKSYEGGFSKKGTVKISSLPDIGQTDFDVPNNEVHVFGRADVFVRPTTQDSTKVVIDGVYDLGKQGHSTANPHFYVEQPHLTTLSGSNFVSDADGFDFSKNGVEIGDLISLEDGADAGLYVVGSVSTVPAGLYLNRKLANSGTVRYRIMKDIRLNPFEPRISKFPFGEATQRDLNSTIGEKLVTFTQNDLLTYNAKAGDTLRIVDGPDAGDYVIESFDPSLGGKGVYLDRELTATSSAIPFEVFTPLSPVERPLVRLRELLLLDSAKQSTGLTIPPADPVAVAPTSSFTSAKVLGQSQVQSGYVLPDLSGLLVYASAGSPPLEDHAALAGDRRYSMDFDQPNGTYISVIFPDGSQAELDLRSDSSGKTSFFLATTESFNDPVNYPPVSPKAGECLTLKEGPNKGSYLIRAVHKFKYKVDADKTAYVYFIQIHGSFPVDPLKQVVNFLKADGTATGLEVVPGSFPLAFPGFFTNFYDNLGTGLASALGGASPPSSAELQAVVESLSACSYEWGMPARGVLRSYFREPTLFEQYTADADKVTTYTFQTNTKEKVLFRPDPTRYQKQEMLPARLTSDAQPTDYPRDIVAEYVVPIASATTPVDVGSWVKGSTSKAEGEVVSIAPNGSLILINVSGTFINGETLLGDPAGSLVAGPTPGYINSVRFTNSTRPSIFSSGIQEGDVLTLHEEIVSLTGSKMKQLVVKSVAGSQQVTALAYPDPAGPFETAHVGALLFISEGDETGGYRITKFVDGWNVLLDRALGTTSTVAAKTGVDGLYYFDGTLNIMGAKPGTTPFGNEDVGSYITLFNIDYRWMGSFKIDTVSVDGSYITVETPAGTTFPPPPAIYGVSWAISAAPSSVPLAVVRGAHPPAQSPSGTELLVGHAVRIYESVPKETAITLVGKEVDLSSCDLADLITDGIDQPFRIFRPNVRRVTPSELDALRDGFLCYFDTEVVSLAASSSSNLAAESYLVPDPGSFWSIGYRHIVVDPNFSYSVKETGFLDLPPFVLPVGSVDSVDSLVRVVGAPLQITYERADLVSLIQDFVDSASDRLIGASLLSRHFLPSYVSYDATYVGGSDPSVIAKDIRDTIDQTPVETSIDVSEIEALIVSRGGNPDTPTKVSATTYDWNRKMWVEFSENELGGAGSVNTKVPYNGSPRVTAFMPGQDVSGLDIIPIGERINLTRR